MLEESIKELTTAMHELTTVVGGLKTDVALLQDGNARRAVVVNWLVAGFSSVAGAVAIKLIERVMG